MVVPGAKGAERGKTGSSSLLWLAFLSFLPPNWSPTNPSVTTPAELRGVMVGGRGQDWGHRRRTKPHMVQGGGQGSPRCPIVPVGDNQEHVRGQDPGPTCCPAEAVGAQKTFLPLAVTSGSQKHHQLPVPLSCVLCPSLQH